MPFSSGTFTPQYNWSNEAAAGNPIDPTKFTAEEADIATGLSTCILKDGTQTVTADIPWNGKKITGLGTPTSAADAATKGYVDGQFITGTYTGTLTGCTTSPTMGISYQRMGNLVILNIASGNTGTSNSNQMTITGAPSGIRPSVATGFITVCGDILNNGVDDNATVHFVTMNAAGTLTFYRASSSPTTWTSSGTKGIGSQGMTIVYLIV